MMRSDNEEKYGKKIQYDPLWKGPMDNYRNPTDRIWLIVFSVFVVFYICIASYGFIAGDVQKFAKPMDSTGRSCGVDAEVKNRSYLMPLNFQDCTDQDLCSPTVCVASCPTRDFVYEGPIATPLEDVKKELICTPEINVTAIVSFQQLDILVANKRCSGFYLKSQELLGKCIPAGDYQTLSEVAKAKLSEDTFNAANRDFLEMQSYVRLIITAKAALGPAILVAILCGVIAVTYVVLLRWFAKQFFYVSVLLTLALVIYGIYRLSVAYASAKEARDSSIYALVMLSIIAVVIVLFVILFRKRIYLACQLIKESSKAVLHLSSTLAFPILPWLLYALVISFFLVVLGHFLSIEQSEYRIEKILTGKMDDCRCTGGDNATIVNAALPYNGGEICDPTAFGAECKAPNNRTCLFLYCNLQVKSSPGYMYFLHACNLFGLYWLIFFISGFQYMVLGGTFATWYWTYNKNNVDNYGALMRSASRTINFHMGTIAVGSLILAIVQVIRNMLNAIKEKLRERNNAVGMAIMCVFQCLFDLLDAFLNFLNYNAYIMCAVHGKNFVSSARSAFNLLMRNLINVIVVENVVDWILELAKWIITAFGMSVVYLYYSMSSQDPADLATNEVTIALVLTAVFAYAICSVFFSVQNVAVKTVFLCFLEDSERNDGTEEKPYFMSEKLKKLLSK